MKSALTVATSYKVIPFRNWKEFFPGTRRRPLRPFMFTQVKVRMRSSWTWRGITREGKLYQESTFEITRLYYETGLKLDESFKLPPDQIAVELEFMAYLAFNEHDALRVGNKENAEYAAGMQEKVLNDYLSSLALNVGDRIADQAKTVFYQTIGCLLKALFGS